MWYGIDTPLRTKRKWIRKAYWKVYKVHFGTGAGATLTFSGSFEEISSPDLITAIGDKTTAGNAA